MFVGLQGVQALAQSSPSVVTGRGYWTAGGGWRRRLQQLLPPLPEPEQVPASARDPVLHSLLRDPGPVTTNKPTFLFNPLLQMFSWFIPFQSLAPTRTQSHLLFTLAGAPPLPSPAAGSPPLPPCRSGGRFSDGPVVIYMSVSLARL